MNTAMMTNKGEKNVVAQTKKFWEMVNLAGQLMNAGINYNPLKSITDSEFRTYCKAAVRFTQNDRMLGLSHHFYRTAVDSNNASKLLADAAAQGMTAEQFRAYVKGDTPKVTPIHVLKRQCSKVAKLRFDRAGKKNYVSILRHGAVVYACAGSTVLSLKDVETVHEKMKTVR